eukprot:TRINITY_DN4428_c0_g1_i1.p1 TRINITY_DN4428_c0_g1~~TRINITY_DN4428_c0_g1_i1.p1  ORF type:complete len:144 (+),score=32.14 TRINITY_DN4428_c0_g1_i1:29-460(+)
MKITLQLLLLGILFGLVKSQTVLKAAAQNNNVKDCFCQCSSLTFRDRNNRVNGNCLTTFQGAQWCYITSEAAKNGDCPDAIPSRRYPGRSWSYFACATPTLRNCVFDALNFGGCSQLTVGNRINLKSSAPQSSPAISNDPDSP